ncbi:MAG: transcription elongation factor GreA [Myxococcota bacterium]|nr:transcription elongation factor GreA [Myxococcota bacterium]
MSFQRRPMTPFGLRRLKEELRQLREVDKPANVRAIEEARAHGDLSENAEFKYAKEQQSFIAGREKELETVISAAEVIDPATLSGDRVVFGATVQLMDTETEEEFTYTIVGDVESDAAKGRISISSPIARGLIGHTEGDVCTIKTPKSIRKLEVLEVSFESCESWD